MLGVGAWGRVQKQCDISKVRSGGTFLNLFQDFTLKYERVQFTYDSYNTTCLCESYEYY